MIISKLILDSGVRAYVACGLALGMRSAQTRTPSAKLQSMRVSGPRRCAFTLIELLVVIAIIVVLIGLIIVAVPKALDPANEAVTRTDMAQLSAAIQSF